MIRSSLTSRLLPFAPAVVALVVVAVGALACGPVDEPPGEFRVCCPDGETVAAGCPEDSCDLEAE